MKYKSIILMINLLVVSSCGLLEPDEKIAFVNNSDLDVYCQWSPHYPDTLTVDYHLLKQKPSTKVKAHGSISDIKTSPFGWRGYFKSCKSDTLLVFVIDASKVDSVGFDLKTWIQLYDSLGYRELYDRYVIRHYKLDCYTDLDPINWTITYP